MLQWQLLVQEIVGADLLGIHGRLAQPAYSKEKGYAMEMDYWWLIWLIEIAQGLIGSLFAALVIFLTRKWWYSKFQSELAYVYRTKKGVDKALKKDIEHAKTVKIMSMRGETLYKEIKEVFSDSAKITVMMSSISNDDAIGIRAKALGETTKEYKRALARHIGNYTDLEAKNSNLVLRFHSVNIPFRLIFIDDKYVYVSQYPKKGGADKSKHYKYVEDKGNAYFAYHQYFEEVFKSVHNYVIEKGKVKSFQETDGNHDVKGEETK